MIENNYNELTKDETLRTSAVAFFLAVIAGVAVFVWAVAITHVAAANVAAAATAVAYAAAVSAKTVTTGTEKPLQKDKEKQSIITDNHLLKLWMLKSNNKTSICQFLNEYQKERVDMYLDAVREVFPNELSETDLIDIRNLIEINLNR